MYVTNKNLEKFCWKGVTAQYNCDCKLQSVKHAEAWLDTTHNIAEKFTNVAYVQRRSNGAGKAGQLPGAPYFEGAPRQLTIWTIGNVIIKNIHVTWSNISASPLWVPLSCYAGRVFFFLVMLRPPFSNSHSTYSCIYYAILKNKITYPFGSQKRKKERKGGKEETWQR